MLKKIASLFRSGKASNTVKNEGKSTEGEDSKNYRESISCLNELSPGEVLPYDPQHCKDTGDRFFKEGQWTASAECFQRAILIDSRDAEAHNKLGDVYYAQQMLSEAETCYRKSLEVAPTFHEALINLGLTLDEQAKHSEAETCYMRCIELKPDSAIAHFNLGVSLVAQGRIVEAERPNRRALEINPDFSQAYFNLGHILGALQRYAEAEACYRDAVSIKSDFVEAYCNLGHILKDTKRLSEAETCFRKALELRPGFLIAVHNLSMVLLAQGRYEEAWHYHESRYDPRLANSTAILPQLSFPKWNGEPLKDKSLLIWYEQGLGDYIQFVRYATLLKQCGVSRLTLVGPAPLKDLLETADGVDQFVIDVAPIKVDEHDFWCFPMSLPLHFSTTLENIPNKLPYLYARPDRIKRWSNHLPASGLKVGLVWKGNKLHKNDANRSLPNLSVLRPLWRVPNITFVSLQKLQAEEEVMHAPDTQPIIALGANMLDMADTAAIVTQLDLVICVDTAVAHLTGALGKPCWVLLPAHGCDWRWLDDRSDSPWYPEVMTLFRQTRSGNWDDTIESLALRLAQWASETGCDHSK
ncbi:tetratricopeptide repeat protein [Undibacterium sp. Di24W]|uniref:tetratricopeptide repeat protein n=1 Tax=Undibacterium sp. Di24W TaxID=3413033 RepID=UPI003BF0719A